MAQKLAEKAGPLILGKLPGVGVVDKDTGEFTMVSREAVLPYYVNKEAADFKKVFARTDYGDYSDLVGPSVTNTTQASMVKMLFGNDTAKTLMFLKAALNGGLFSNYCPSADRPDFTEPAVDPRTGKIFCRAPQENYRKPDDGVKCDMFNLEKYVDHLGQTICRRPVMSGYYSCPPPDRPDDKMHIITEDGEGLCVNPLTYSDLNVGLSYAVFPFNTNAEVARYLVLLGKSVKLDGMDKDSPGAKELLKVKRDAITKLNQHLLTYLASPSRTTFDKVISLVTSDPQTAEYAEIVKNLRSGRDVMNLNGALFITNRHQLGTDYSLDEWYRWFGIPRDAFGKN